MSAIAKLKTNNIFEIVPDDELKVLFSQIHVNQIAMVGKTDEGVIIVFRPSQRTGSYNLISGQFRSNSNNSESMVATFSFNIEEAKYLFKAKLTAQRGRKADLELLTTMYRIQRRSERRLKIPNDYYAVVKLTHQNGRLVRIFGKLMDISPRGMGIFIPKENSGIKSGEQLKVVISISQRPPESVEMRVVHMRSMIKEDPKSKDKSTGTFLGASFVPELSLNLYKRMNAVVMDIYRDIFGSLSID